MEGEIKKLSIEKGIECIYILRLPDITYDVKNVSPLYKFGMTADIQNRLATHLKNLKFTSIVVCMECEKGQMVEIEKMIKRTAESFGERRNILGNTEIIETSNIGKYIDSVYAAKYAVRCNDKKDEKLDEINEKLDEINEKIENLEQNQVNIEINGDNNENVIEVNVNTDECVKRNLHKTCGICGKVFRTPAEYKRHSNNVSPCFIKEVPPEQLNHPNRCIYCNKIFTNTGNKNKHLRSCKFKN